MSIHYAHLAMLAAQGIVRPDDAHALRVALDTVSQPDVRRAAYDGRSEDLFFHIDRLIAGACGEEVAGRLHTARSRNDIDMTMYRMRQRELILALAAGTLRAAARADRSRRTATAQRSSPCIRTRSARSRRRIAHYLLAVVEQLERDFVRLHAAYETTNRCPARRLRDYRHRVSRSIAI